jgi:hypothetical protein
VICHGDWIQLFVGSAQRICATKIGEGAGQEADAWLIQR